MPTPYDIIFENVLPKFRDFDIPLMTVDEVRELLHDHLRPAIVQFHICQSDLFDRDEELKEFNTDLQDDEIEILSNFMLLSYLDSNYIKVPLVLKASLSTKDFNAFSPANHLDKLLTMHRTFLAENETLLSRYAWKQKAKQIKEHNKNDRFRKIRKKDGCCW